MNWKTVIFCLRHAQKFGFQLKGTFFHCLNPFLGFSFQSNPHSADPFLILRNTRFHTIYELLLLLRAPQDCIDTTVIISFVSSSVTKEPQK